MLRQSAQFRCTLQNHAGLTAAECDCEATFPSFANSRARSLICRHNQCFKPSMMRSYIVVTLRTDNLCGMRWTGEVEGHVAFERTPHPPVTSVSDGACWPSLAATCSIFIAVSEPGWGQGIGNVSLTAIPGTICWSDLPL